MAGRNAHTAARALCLATLFFGCGDEHGPAAALRVLDPNPPLTIGAAEGRPASVVLPSDYSIDAEYPLVILLHGFGANAQAQDLIFQLAPRTTPFQFILVLPEGTFSSAGQRFWDATPECCNFNGPPVDDVSYLAALMEEALEIYAVDPDRIRLAGHSNGGYMSYRYACEQPIAIDRIAVLAGSTYLGARTCGDPRPIDVLHMHGTDDQTIRYHPNLPPDLIPGRALTIGAEATVERWAAIAGCDPGLELVERRDHHRIPGEPAETEVLRPRNCDAGRTIELWRGNAADHVYLTVNNTWRDEVAAFLSE